MSDSYHHSIPLAVKFSAASEAGTFSGYASTFGGKPDAYGDVIAAGAFAKSIAEHRAAGTVPALLWSHDQSQPIGVITHLVEDAKGLRVDGKLTLEVVRAAEAYALMKAGALAFSIGYKTVQATSLGRGVRQLNELKLYEISAVAIPANSSAKIISVKARPDVTDQNNPRAIEQILRDAGVARNQAKRIVSLGKSAFRERDVLIADSKLSQKLIAASRAIEKFI
jgi:HK97 family phage prohead protease